MKKHSLSFTYNPGGGEYFHKKYGRLQVYCHNEQEDYEKLFNWVKTGGN